MTLGPRTYAPILAGIMLLWPIIAYMGAQGFSIAIALLAIIALFYLKLPRPTGYGVLALAFASWVLFMDLWGANQLAFIEGSITAGSLTIDVPALRFTLTILAGLALIVAIHTVRIGSSHKSLGWITAIGLIQAGGVIGTAVLIPQILQWLAPFSDPVREMPQNLLRNANTYLLLLPFLLAWLWHRGKSEWWPALAMALGMLSLGAFMQTGSQIASAGIVLAVIAMALVRFFPRNGFKILGTGLAGFIAAAPMLYGYGVSKIRDFAIPLPESFVSRTYAWELVAQKIGEKPFMGHGLEASQGWTDTFDDHPEWLADVVSRYGNEASWTVYEVIPSHPHSMPLQIWAETGLVGAILASLFVFFLFWRLKAPALWPPIARYAAAGLAGVAFALCSFGQSMWNEALWASMIIAGGIILLQARHQGEADT